MAKDYAALVATNRALVEAEVTAMSRDDRLVNARRQAVQALNRFNALLPTSLTEAQYTSAVPNLVTMLTVPYPTTPADLTTLSAADLVTLAQAHELARWDYEVRMEQVYAVEDFYKKLGFVAGTTANAGIAAIRATLVTFMNYVRGTRTGLPTVS